MTKIAIIGGYGAVGRYTALLLGQRNLMDALTVIGPNAAKAEATALDLKNAYALGRKPIAVSSSSDYAAIADSDIVLITAGKYRSPEMTRDALVTMNADILTKAGEAIAAYAPDAFVIVVTNPLDAMVEHLYRAKGGDPRKIVGMAGILDSVRLRNFIAEECGVPLNKVDAFIMGEHGESMLAVFSRATIDGQPFANFCDAKQAARILQHTRQAGKTILELSGVPANIAPAVGIATMAQSYLRDENVIIPACARLNGEYGLRDIFIGTPTHIGKAGAFPIEILLNADEQKALHASAAAIKTTLARLPDHASLMKPKGMLHDTLHIAL